MALPHVLMGWSTVCDCGISMSYLFLLPQGKYLHLLINFMFDIVTSSISMFEPLGKCLLLAGGGGRRTILQ